MDRGSPEDIRQQGWAVAVHNDYKLGGKRYTFWLFTKGNAAVSGEGESDAAALDNVRSSIQLLGPTSNGRVETQVPTFDARVAELTRMDWKPGVHAVHQLEARIKQLAELVATLEARVRELNNSDDPAGWRDWAIGVLQQLKKQSGTEYDAQHAQEQLGYLLKILYDAAEDDRIEG